MCYTILFPSLLSEVAQICGNLSARQILGSSPSYLPLSPPSYATLSSLSPQCCFSSSPQTQASTQLLSFQKLPSSLHNIRSCSSTNHAPHCILSDLQKMQNSHGLLKSLHQLLTVVLFIFFHILFVIKTYFFFPDLDVAHSICSLLKVALEF